MKLLGRGEYIVERAGEPATGHFGLAVQDYTHSTAPNRRFPDLVAQRIVKAALAQQAAPYTDGELASIAARCTEREDAANKVERLVRRRRPRCCCRDGSASGSTASSRVRPRRERGSGFAARRWKADWRATAKGSTSAIAFG